MIKKCTISHNRKTIKKRDEIITSMTKVFLVRHAQPKGKMPNDPLTEEGVVQAKLTANLLSKYKIDRVFVSDITRCTQTFDEYHKLNPQVPFEISKKMRELSCTIVGGKDDLDIVNESIDYQEERVDTLFYELFHKKHNYENVVIFTHGNVIRYLLSKILKIDPTNLWSMMVAWSSVSILDTDYYDNPGILSVNNVTHLDSDVKDWVWGDK